MVRSLKVGSFEVRKTSSSVKRRDGQIHAGSDIVYGSNGQTAAFVEEESSTHTVHDTRNGYEDRQRNNGVDSGGFSHSYRCEKKWAVPVVCFLMYFLVAGFSGSFGALYTQMLDEFGASRVETSSVQATCIGVLGVSGLVTGAICDRLGVRKAGIYGGVMCSLGVTVSYFATNISFLVISIGIVGGFGFSQVFLVGIVSPVQYFEGKQLAFVTAFISSGICVGGLVFPYVLTFLSEEFGLKGTFLICGGLLMNTIPASMIAQSSQSNTITNTQQNTDNVGNNAAMTSLIQFVCDFKDLLINPQFVLFSLPLAITMACLNIPWMVVTDYMSSLGFENTEGVFILTLINVTSIIARALLALLRTIPRLPVLLIPLIFAISGGAAMGIMPLTRGYIPTVVFMLVTNFGQGGIWSSYPLTTVELVNPRMYSTAVGLIMSVFGCGVMAGGPLSGMLKDSTGVYDLAFYLGGGVCMVCAVVMTLSICCARMKSRMYYNLDNSEHTPN
ncbi:hypothetical protein ScPMuIL_009099 [Solemya velum]